MNRREARDQAFCLLFEKSFKDDSLEEIIESAMLARDIKVSSFAEKVFSGIAQNEQQVDQMIEENIIGWKKNRLSRVAVSVLRVAVYEMLFDDTIPVSVSINEAVDLAKKYGSGDDAAFINGVLGSIAKKLEKAHE